MIGLIMAGGSGTRFWPLSRKSNPKQFLRLFDNKSMIQLTFERLHSFINAEDIYVVTTKDQRDLVIEHLDLIPKENIIIEPFGMNTAPCVGLSTHFLASKYPADSNLLIVPSDQLILEVDAFQKAVFDAVSLSDQGSHVVFGIVPTYPATGYGYIEKGEAINKTMFHVKQFKEKPDYQTATQFVNSGNFYWNCGMFLWKLETILASLDLYYHQGNELLKQIAQLNFSEDHYDQITALYKQMPKQPIDIAIMEKVPNGSVIPLNVGWNDVGSWYSLHEVVEKDEQDNKIYQPSYVINSKGNFIYSQKPVALIDVDNLILVETDDAILVMPKNSSEKVKEIVDKLQKEKPDLL